MYHSIPVFEVWPFLFLTRYRVCAATRVKRQPFSHIVIPPNAGRHPSDNVVRLMEVVPFHVPSSLHFLYRPHLCVCRLPYCMIHCHISISKDMY